MKERVMRLLHEKELQLKRKQAEIEAFESDPLLFFTDLQYDKYLLPNVLSEANESFLSEYQEWQYPLVAQTLSETFNTKPFEIRWNTEAFPSPIYFLFEGYPVACIEPYEQRFVLLPSQEVTQLLEQYRLLQKQKIDIWAKWREVSIRHQNPFIDHDESVFDTLKIAVKKKNIRKQYGQEADHLERSYTHIQDESNRLELQLNTLVQNETPLHYEVEHLYQKMKHRLPLKFHDAHKEAIQDAQQEIYMWQAEAEKTISRLEDKGTQTEQL